MKKSLVTPIVTLLLAMMLMLSAGPVFAQGQDAAGENATANSTVGWFKSQLNKNEETFYSAIEELYKSGGFATGKGSLNLTDRLSQDNLQAYANGDVTLAQAFQNARDAFCQDYPDVFYVDFSKLTLRVGTTAGGSFEAYLNSGSNENYFAAGYTEANIGAAIDGAASAKRDIIASIDQTKDRAEIVTAVHDALINKLEYSYPTTEHPHVRGVDALQGGFANCDGYSRSLKWILDELDIPNVLVLGIGKNSLGNSEAHGWNLVQIESDWYAVDVTWDDPMSTRATEGNAVNKYLLKGEGTIRDNHFASSRFSNGAKEFIYPALCTNDYGTPPDPVTNDLDTDLKITTSKYEDESGKNASTKFTVSYKELTVNQMASQNLYYAYRFVDEAGDITKWFYLEDTVNNDNPYVNTFLFRKGTVQFCVTNLHTTNPTGEYEEDLSLKENHVVLSKNMNVTYTTDYVSPPFIQKSTPALTQARLPVDTHYDIEYDDALVKVNDAADVTIKIENSTDTTIKAEVKNVTTSERTVKTADGKEKTFTTISFDFSPDKTYQGYANTYKLLPQNLVGSSSKEAPNPISIKTNFPTKVQCPHTVAKGELRNAFVVASPTLLLNNGMDDMFDYGEFVGTKPTSLDIQLIASIPNKEEAGKIASATPDPDNILSSASYDLSLSCRGVASSLKRNPGTFHLTVGVPYPSGFDYNTNKDVQFKAYHYVKQENGTYKAEELVCVITPLGLQIIADSFSPFTVVAVEKSAKPPVGNSKKIINVSSGQSGGIVKTATPSAQSNDAADASKNVAVGLYTLEDADSKTFNIEADAGYVIDKLLVNNTPVKDAAGKTNYDYTFEAAKMQNKNDLQVSFIAESIKAEEEKNNFAPAPEPAVKDTEKPEAIKVSTIAVTTKNDAPSIIDAGSSLELKAQVEPTNATDQDLFWASSDNNIATVNPATGIVKGVSKGEVSISATAKDGSGKSTSMKITVKDVPVESITLSADKTTITVGDTLTINQDIKPATATNQTLDWSTSDANVATVAPSANGSLVTAASKGQVKITATAKDGSGANASVTITVNEKPVPAPVPVESITLSADKTTLTVGDTLTINKDIKPTTATNQTLDWSTSDAKIGTVDPSTGVVTAVSKGQVTITATAKDGSRVFGTLTLTIKDKTIDPVNTPKPTTGGSETNTETGAKSASTGLTSTSNLPSLAVVTLTLCGLALLAYKRKKINK